MHTPGRSRLQQEVSRLQDGMQASVTQWWQWCARRRDPRGGCRRAGGRSCRARTSSSWMDGADVGMEGILQRSVGAPERRSELGPRRARAFVIHVSTCIRSAVVGPVATGGVASVGVTP